MSAGHKGPWRVERRDSCWAVVDALGQEVAFVDRRAAEFEGAGCGSVASRGRTAEELASIARLVAAAPDLLDACKKLINCVDPARDWEEAKSARAAIAKAEDHAGETRCYSDHNEDVRTKGSCDYCRGTREE